MYALPRSSIEKNAYLRLGTLYSGSSIIKNDFLNLAAVIAFMRSAPRSTSAIPTMYATQLTHLDSGKNAPAKSAITGSLAPQGMKVASIAVALFSLWLRIVRHAMIAGIPQPVPMIIGITDLPDRPTLLKIGSRTTVALDMYPQSSRSAIRKYITITSGRKPTTAPTPPITPSTRRAYASGFASAILSPTQPWKVSIQPTNISATHVPTVV